MRPTELQEQIAITRSLKRSGICFAAVPNGGKRDRREAISLRSSGVQRGVPDLLIFDPPPALPGKVGTALEMKREGGRMSNVTKEQVVWLDRLEARGWVSLVGFGADDATHKLQALGYEVKI